MKTVPHGYVVGDAVSYGFNGDWYPCGEVARITKKFLTTTTGHKFSLHTITDRLIIRNDEGRAIDSEDVLRETFRSIHGGTWCLAKGTINERNPHF